MSLINQALKLEQQRRHSPNGPTPPMLSHIGRNSDRNKLPIILLGLTGTGMILALCLTAVFYFGAEYLETGSDSDGSQRALASSQNSQLEIPSPATNPQTSNVQDLIGGLTPEQLSTVQQMLLQQAEEQKIDTPAALPVPASAPELQLSDISRIQAVVDGFSVQGIRKAGQETRVFMNGKIQRIGDTVDIQNGLILEGFTETALIFHSPDGHRFEKAL